MIIEWYGDIISPWAFLGRYQLQRALELLDPEVAGRIHIVWRPQLVDPTAPSPSVDWADAALDPSVDAAIQQTEPGVEAGIRRIEAGELAHQLGFEHWGARWRASSWAAHRMITAAGDHDSTPRGPSRQRDVVEAIGRAQFVEGADINSLSFLRSIADRFELPGPVALQGSDAALAYLQPGFDADDPVERATREAQLFGQAVGVTVSPTLVIADRVIAEGPHTPEELAELIIAEQDPAHTSQADGVPDEVRRLRAARTLLERARNPLGALYLLAPLRPDYDGVRGLETLTARALAASASLEPARAKLVQLLDKHPDDAYLQMLLGKTLKRMQHPEADKHLALAVAMNPEYLDF